MGELLLLVEVLVSGILYGGVLMLLTVGLNLIFGVINVVWLCYAELVMVGMYGFYWLHTVYDIGVVPAGLITIAIVAALGVGIHLLVVAPLIQSQPINQLLATGGVLFLLQSLASLAFGTEFRSSGIFLPVIEIGGIYVSFARMVSFAVACVIVLMLYAFLRHSFTGVAIRAIAMDREVMGLVGVSERRIYLMTSAIGGGLAGLAGCLFLLQYDVQPFVGLSFGPIAFVICVLGGLGNLLGGAAAAFIMSIIIAVFGFYTSIEFANVVAFVFFIVAIFIKPEGLFR